MMIDEGELSRIRRNVPAGFDKRAVTSEDYARGAKAKNTYRAYAADWRHFTLWCARHGAVPLPPEPQTIGLYLAACVSEAPTGPGGQGLSVRTIERRLSALAWHCNQRSMPFLRTDRHIAEAMAGIRRRYARPPKQKEAILADELCAMLATLDHDLRGLRDRGMLLIGFAGGLRRSEIVGLDCGQGQTEDGCGWVEVEKRGVLITLSGRTRRREVVIGRGASEATCPAAALERWLGFSKIHHGPLFRRVTKNGANVAADRLNDKHVARLVQRCALAAGLRRELTEGERKLIFSGDSLRAGSAEALVDARYVQTQLGHTSAETIRRGQRRRDNSESI
jgi:integrase